jgi:hypothetical protein
LKYRTLLIIAIVFFLVQHTLSFWEGLHPLLLLAGMMLLFITWFILAVLLGYFVIAKKPDSPTQIATLIIAAVVVGLAYYRPFGIINLRQFESKDLLIAEREGAANCTTTFRLKKDKTFRERNVCFGVTKQNGHYSIHNDTIIFSGIDKDVYKFAVIKPPDSLSESKAGDFFLYRASEDTTPLRLWIIRNELTLN